MNQLEHQLAADVVTNVYQNLEEQLMANIAKHLKDYKQPIATDEWLMKKLAEIGKLNQENIKIIAKATGLAQDAAEQMLTDTATKVLAEIEPVFDGLRADAVVDAATEVGKSKNVKQVMSTMTAQAEDVINLTNTNMLYKARDAYAKVVSQTASAAQQMAADAVNMEILNTATASVVTGTESRTQALRGAIRDFSDKGIAAFVDKRGREWTPEAYINMAMRTTSNTMAAEMQFARADDYDLNLVEVDSHAGARPKCARDQGKIFDRSNKSTKYPHWNTSSYGEPDGLLGINCGHHIYPYMEGVSIRRHFPTEDLEANDKLYKETQMQRGMERDVRKQKRRCMLFDQLGDDEAFEDESYKLKLKEKKLRDYVDSNPNLHRRKDREQVLGFDRTTAAKAVGANKRAVNKKLAEFNKKKSEKEVVN